MRDKELEKRLKISLANLFISFEISGTKVTAETILKPLIRIIKQELTN